MLIQADRILGVLGKHFAQLAASLPDSATDGSPAQAIGCVLRLLAEREAQGAQGIRKQFEQLAQVIEDLGDCGVEPQHPDLEGLRHIVHQVADSDTLAALEEAWRTALAALEALIADALQDRALTQKNKARLRRILVDFEVADLQQQLGKESTGSTDDSKDITPEKLAAYLRDRFSEPDLEVTSLKPLSGGFGKQTIVFSTRGKALEGEFVMRRDIGNNAALDNDCHHVHQEYEVIKAVHEHGFLSPDVLWLDRQHALLPGGDFIVMRRSPGTMAGNFFGSQTEVPKGLAAVLARHTAALHNLPALETLGDLTESISRRHWHMTQRQATESYLRGWYDYWRGEVHAPSPAIVALYSWLFDHIPDRDGSAVLVHGDIGFHNILMEKDEVSVILDWEFAHVGDPAEDLGYIKVTTGNALDWGQFMDFYVAAGGKPADEKAIHFFQVWAFVRNACAANVITSRFTSGKADDLKLAVLPYLHFPLFIRSAQDLIEQMATDHD
ncbi:MAG: phosphotransferase family protein [Porticoccaceae bacterium]